MLGNRERFMSSSNEEKTIRVLHSLGKSLTAISKESASSSIL